MAQAAIDTQDVKQSLQTGDWVVSSLFALAVYEYAVTFDQEVSCVWGKKITLSSVLLLSTRWVMVSAKGMNALVAPNPSICRPFGAISVVDQAFTYISIIQIALFASLRVYALYHDSRYRYLFSSVTLTLSCVPIATNSFSWSLQRDLYVGPPLSTCLIEVVISERLNSIMLYFTRCSALTAELLVVVLTWLKTFAHWRQLRRLNHTSSVSTLLLRDGTVYFLFLLALDVAQIMRFRLQSVDGVGNIVLDLLLGMPPILTQRFMLNLRQFDLHSTDGVSTWSANPASTIKFIAPPRILGNIGEPLSFDAVETLDEDSDGSSEAVLPADT